MFPTSIHWRLPLSYAAIAILTTLSLGVVLLTALQQFYRQQELDYLVNNARTVSANITPLIEAGLPPEILQSHLSSLAFLSQTQVQFQDADGNIIASAGAPDETQEVLALSLEIDVETETYGSTQTLTRTVALSGHKNSYTPLIALRNISNAPDIKEVEIVRREGEPGTAEDSVIREHIAISATGSNNLNALIDQEIRELEGLGLVSFIPTAGTPYGFGLGLDPLPAGRRSDQIVKHPLYDARGHLLGFVQLSRGPAYGHQVLANVAGGWAVAGSVSVILAAAAGWLVSRRMSAPLLVLTATAARMAHGDLSVRANVNRRDEFGTLGHAFDEMAQQVEQTVATLRRFVADAAHELHTPLTALRTNLELATGAETNPRQKIRIKQAQTQLTRLERLTNSLLDLSRLERKTNKVAFGQIELKSFLQKTCEPYASQAEQMGLTFSLQLPQKTIMVVGNKAQLKQAIGNLLDNALKFTPPGGAITLGLALTPNGTTAKIWVEDTGIGIPADDLPQLFSRFHRGRNATAYPGNGLGLAIVKAIVEVHNGQVNAATSPQGTCFSLCLPVASHTFANLPQQ